MMQRLYDLNQVVLLKKEVADARFHRGVCWAMSYDWIKRVLCNFATHKGTFTGNIDRYVSQQRAYVDSVNSDFEVDYAKGDSLTAVSVNRGDIAGNNEQHWMSLRNALCLLSPGVYSFSVTFTDSGHAMALSVSASGCHFFDPEQGLFFNEGPRLNGDYLMKELLYPIYEISSWEIVKYTGQPRDKAWLSMHQALPPRP